MRNKQQVDPRKLLEKISPVLIGIFICTLGFYSRYHIKGYDSIGLNNEQTMAVMSVGSDSVDINIETLCINTRDAIFIHFAGSIPISNEDVKIVQLSEKFDGIQIIMNEGRQLILYFEDPTKNPSAIGYELNAPLSGDSTKIDIRVVFHTFTNNGTDSIFVVTDTRAEYQDRKAQVINPPKVGTCIEGVWIGEKTERLENLNVSIGVGQLDNVTKTQLVLVIRSALLILSVWFVFASSKALKKRPTK
jgi:hypothetical protein